MNHNEHSMKLIIQDTWNEPEDQDLLEYTKQFNPIFMSEQEILAQNPKDAMIFADTKIIQSILSHYQVIPCYPEVYAHLYKRDIQVQLMNYLDKFHNPCFIKPYSNDKSFESHLVRTEQDMEFLKKEIAESGYTGKLYVCELVKFVSEYRLFVGPSDGKHHVQVHGMVESTDEIIGGNTDNPPPKEFIDEVLKHSPGDYCVVDVGMLDTGEWAVVEVNPPFAITSYGLDIEQYYQYCCDAWKYITTSPDSDDTSAWEDYFWTGGPRPRADPALPLKGCTEKNDTSDQTI